MPPVPTAQFGSPYATGGRLRNVQELVERWVSAFGYRLQHRLVELGVESSVAHCFPFSLLLL
jgi:hypothetical protein